MAEQRRDVYMNHIQMRMFYIMARKVWLDAARRFGKTDGGIGPRMWAAAETMPQGQGAFLGTSRKQLFTRTVPAAIAALRRFYNFKEGIHFGWGRPPKTVPSCIIKPTSGYENYMWFANGWLWYAASLATMGSVNGMTLNSLIADECKFLPKKKIDEEVMPALSGIPHPTGHPGFSDANPLYKSEFFCSDASLSSKGNWLAKGEAHLKDVIDEGEFAGKTYAELNAELNRYADRVIFFNETLRSAKKAGIQPIEVSQEDKDFIADLWASIERRDDQFKILPPQYKDPKAIADYLLNYKVIDQDTAELLAAREYLLTHDDVMEMMAIRKSKKYRQRIDALRREAFYFVRASSLDNIDILGESYIRQMRLSLPPLVFATSILNLRLGKVGEGFYYNFDPDVHCYIDDGSDTPISDSYKIKQGKTLVGGTMYPTEYESPDFDYLSAVNDCSLDGDCRDKEDLYIAFDAGKIVSWIVTGQIYRRDGEQQETLNILSSMFVKDGRMVQHLIQDWARYYAPHLKKNRRVHFFYDHTFKFKPHGVYIDDIKDTIIKELKSHGVDVNPVFIGQAWPHNEKYKDIGEGMAGIGYPAVRFNKTQNEPLCAAIENCGVKLSYSGANSVVRKDKAGEKLAVDADRATAGAEPEELRTDGTDAFDTLYIGCRHYRQSSSFLMTPGGR